METPSWSASWADELFSLDGAIGIANLARGTRLYEPEDPSDSIFRLQRGQARIAVPGATSKQCVYRLINRGELFGESALWGDSPRRSAAEVVQKAAVTKLPRDVALAFLRTHPELWRPISVWLGQRTQSLEQQLEWVCLHEVEQRIARLLLSWIEARRPRPERSEHISFHLAQKDVAGLVGATRETTSSALNRMQREGYLTIGRRRLGVLSWERLAQYAETAHPPRRMPETAEQPSGEPAQRAAKVATA